MIEVNYPFKKKNVSGKLLLLLLLEHGANRKKNSLMRFVSVIHMNFLFYIITQITVHKTSEDCAKPPHLLPQTDTHQTLALGK